MRRLSICALLVGATLLLGGERTALRGEAGVKPGLQVLFPADRSVVESGKIELLCVAPAATGGGTGEVRLKVDRQPARWEPFKPPVLLSRLDLLPGMHEVVVGDAKLRVFVQPKGGGLHPPDDWKVWRSHEETPGEPRDCAVCHHVARKKGLTAVGDLRAESPCLKCHSADEFAATHFHPLKPLAACQMCHALHGSPRKALLRAPVKEVCARCHDS